MRPCSKRSVCSYLMSRYEASVSLICRTINLSRSTKYRKSTRDDTEVEEKLKQLAAQYSTRGFDWYYLKIRQQGLKWNRKRVLRVYRKLHLQHRRKHKRRINRPYTEGLSQPIMPNICWSMDFMSDALEDGRKVRILTVIDDYNRQCLKIQCGISICGDRVVRILNELVEQYGKPMQIRTDNGPEFTSHVYKIWCETNNVKQLFIQPGKPNQNGFVERFNRTYREDVLDAYIFESLSQLQILSEKWNVSYNTGHPHQSLGGLTPVGFKYSRANIIKAYKNVKTDINDSYKLPLDESVLTFFPPTIYNGLSNIQME